jgi:hypothetical protein
MLFEGRSPKISIIRWFVHVSLTATGRNYEQFRWYWPWHLIIIYKFDQINEADCIFKQVACVILLQISGGQNNIQWALPSIKHEKNNAKRSLRKFKFPCSFFISPSPKISIIRWFVHVSLTATGRNYEQFRGYWPWHLIIIYKFDHWHTFMVWIKERFLCHVYYIQIDMWT